MIKPYNIIVATDLTGGFAKDGKIPWYYKEDFKHFKKVTDGNICIMGKYTYEDIAARREIKDGEQVLPGRECYVVTSSVDEVKGATCIKKLDEIFTKIDYDEKRELFVIGGERLFTEALSGTNKVYMTIINKDYECDKRFPVEYVAKKFGISATYDTDGPTQKTNKELLFVEWTRMVR